MSWEGEERRSGMSDLRELTTKIEHLATELRQDREIRVRERQEDREALKDWRIATEARIQTVEDGLWKPGGLSHKVEANTAGRKRQAALGTIAAVALATPLGALVWKILISTTAGG